MAQCVAAFQIGTLDNSNTNSRQYSEEESKRCYENFTSIFVRIVCK